jgi:cyclase
MLKKRIIFTLLFKDGSFYLSRNFRLQKVGNLEWIKKNYDFSIITKSVDELIILNVSRNKNSIKSFCKTIEIFTKECFIPISAGGKIDNVDVAKKYIDSGVDKLVINTNLFNINLLSKISHIYGEQCLIGSVDYTRDNKIFKFFIGNGKIYNPIKVSELFKKILKLPIGELILNSIDKDGTGNGFDFKILEYIPKNFFKPLIFSGGAGNYLHLLEALRKKKIHSITTANLLNFVGNGLQEARDLILKNGVKLAKW